MSFYQWNPGDANEYFCSKIQKLVGLSFKPYMAEASLGLLGNLVTNCFREPLLLSLVFVHLKERSYDYPFLLQICLIGFRI